MAYSADFEGAAGYVDQTLRGVSPGEAAGAGAGQIYSVSQLIRFFPALCKI
jgi:hypothetical protein